MKSSEKILTYAQAKELKWFCDNIAGVRTDFYSTINTVAKFDERISKLEKTCDLIDKFIRSMEEGKNE